MKHSCNKLISYLERDKYIQIFINYNTEAESWFLIYENYADQQEVKMGEAEEEGELLISVGMRIEFCPFCGAKLSETKG